MTIQKREYQAKITYYAPNNAISTGDTFDIPYPFYNDDECLSAYIRGVDQSVVDLVLDIDYSINILRNNVNAYGVFKFRKDFQDVESVTIFRAMKVSQEKNLLAQIYTPETIEDGLDKLTMIAQDNLFRNYTINAPNDDLIEDNKRMLLPKASERANKVLCFDDNGDVSVQPNVALENKSLRQNRYEISDPTFEMDAYKRGNNFIKFSNGSVDFVSEDKETIIIKDKQIKGNYKGTRGIEINGNEISCPTIGHGYLNDTFLLDKTKWKFGGAYATKIQDSYAGDIIDAQSSSVLFEGKMYTSVITPVEGGGKMTNTRYDVATRQKDKYEYTIEGYDNKKKISVMYGKIGSTLIPPDIFLQPASVFLISYDNFMCDSVIVFNDPMRTYEFGNDSAAPTLNLIPLVCDPATIGFVGSVQIAKDASTWSNVVYDNRYEFNSGTQKFEIGARSVAGPGITEKKLIVRYLNDDKIYNQWLSFQKRDYDASSGAFNNKNMTVMISNSGVPMILSGEAEDGGLLYNVIVDDDFLRGMNSGPEENSGAFLHINYPLMNNELDVIFSVYGHVIDSSGARMSQKNASYIYSLRYKDSIGPSSYKYLGKVDDVIIYCIRSYVNNTFLYGTNKGVLIADNYSGKGLSDFFINTRNKSVFNILSDPNSNSFSFLCEDGYMYEYAGEVQQLYYQLVDTESGVKEDDLAICGCVNSFDPDVCIKENNEFEKINMAHCGNNYYVFVCFGNTYPSVDLTIQIKV